MDNKSISHVFEEMGNILEIQGAEGFRINAYNKAALIVMNLGADLRKIVDKNPRDLIKIPGIGQGLAKKIVELIQTGKCIEHEKFRKSIPDGLLEMLNLRGVGPKKVKLFYSELRIKNIKELKRAAKDGVLRDLPKMGEKSEKEVLVAIEEYSNFSLDRLHLNVALFEAERIIEYMKMCKGFSRIEYAGSLRRFASTVGDIDILISSEDDFRKDIMDHFVKYEDVINVIAQGSKKSSVILEGGIQVDLRVVNENEFGAALHYFTGSKAHNIKIRDLAKRKGLKINEYGVFKGEKMIAGKNEEDVFKSVGLPFIIPEIRRNNGEIVYGLEHKKFPKFVELSDIQGDLHSHSTYSDGKNSIKEMANAFIERGYKYFAVTDHSSVMGVTGGMGKKDIASQWKEIDRLNKKFANKIKILKGVEVDILKDGSLDFADDVLEKLDVVIIAAHMYNRLDEKEQTARLIAAIENPHSNILAHPTGRIINRRAEIKINMEKIIDACIANNVALEINSSPLRLDLSDQYIKLAKDKGASFSINTDSHNTDHVDFIKYGLGTARRGWLEKKDVLNTLSLQNLTASLKRV